MPKSVIHKNESTKMNVFKFTQMFLKIDLFHFYSEQGMFAQKMDQHKEKQPYKEIKQQRISNNCHKNNSEHEGLRITDSLMGKFINITNK